VQHAGELDRRSRVEQVLVVEVDSVDRRDRLLQRREVAVEDAVRASSLRLDQLLYVVEVVNTPSADREQQPVDRGRALLQARHLAGPGGRPDVFRVRDDLLVVEDEVPVLAHVQRPRDDHRQAGRPQVVDHALPS
jgi:hypothetical protein